MASRTRFGGVLKWVRKDSGLTQQAFAVRLFGSSSAADRVKLAEYENGKALPNPRTLNQMIGSLSADEVLVLTRAWLDDQPDLLDAVRHASGGAVFWAEVQRQPTDQPMGRPDAPRPGRHPEPLVEIKLHPAATRHAIELVAAGAI